MKRTLPVPMFSKYNILPILQAGLLMLFIIDVEIFNNRLVSYTKKYDNNSMPF